jgi:Glycosyl transferase family 2
LKLPGFKGMWGRDDGRESKRAGNRDPLSELRREFVTEIGHLRSQNNAGIAELRQELSSSQKQFEAELKDLLGKNETLRTQIAYILDTVGDLPRDRQRVDYVLAEVEGIGGLFADLRAARQTAEFQSAFDERSPLVTVCTGTTERPRLLVERCLKSIREQTYKNLQILIIGDHCSDETAERIAELKDSRIEFYNLPKRGPYPPPGTDRWCVAGTNAANATQPLARGKFITYLDDDDRYEPDRIETLLSVAQANRAEFIWHKFWYLQPDGTWTLWGNGKFEHGQMGTSMSFYHNYFRKIPWDMNAYRIPEPGDWNRLRKIKHLRPNAIFVDKPLTWYYKNYDQSPFVPQEGEEYLV